MFSPELKKEISDAVQEILQNTKHGELPIGEVNFLLHVDGAESWSWANIKNNGSVNESGVPVGLIGNRSM